MIEKSLPFVFGHKEKPIKKFVDVFPYGGSFRRVMGRIVLSKRAISSKQHKFQNKKKLQNTDKQNFTAPEFICLLNVTHALTDRVDEQCKYSYLFQPSIMFYVFLHKFNNLVSGCFISFSQAIRGHKI